MNDKILVLHLAYEMAKVSIAIPIESKQVSVGINVLFQDAVWTVASLESYAVILGIGCILEWVGLLRYLKFNYKFHVSTLYVFVQRNSQKNTSHCNCISDTQNF